MKTSADGFQQCYNAQLAVEGENQLIVAVAVSSNASDQGRLTPLVEAVESTHGRCPETVLADAGYCNEAELDKLETLGVDACVALGREGRRAVEVDAEKHPAKAPIGWIKEALGFRRFSVRGLNKVQGEWDLVCLALNVKRMQGLETTA